jgi:hypothetical protein
MPLIEGSRSREGKREGHRWLPFAIAALLLLVFLPLVPLVYPIRCRIGGQMVMAGLSEIKTPVPPQGPRFNQFNAQAPIEDPDEQRSATYAAHSVVSTGTVRVGDWIYYVIWFTGNRRPADVYGQRSPLPAAGAPR